MMRRGGLIVLLAVLMAGTYGVWRWLFPGDEVLIRRVVREAATAVSWGPETGNLNKLAGAGQLAALCTADVEILLEGRGPASRRLEGRTEVRDAVAGVRLQLDWLRLLVTAMEVTVVEPGESARVVIAASVTMAGVAEEMVQDYVLTMRREDGEWRIARVEPVKGFGM